MLWDGAALLITGASRGIGAAVAEAAAAKGARVGLTARSQTDLEQVLARIDGKGAIATADVGDRAQTEVAIAKLADELGPIDILVNNAGIGAYGSFVDEPVENIERLARVNYLGSVYATKAVLPSMVERRRGHIVFVASIAGRIGAPLEASYSASKFAQVGLAEALSVELSTFDVGVSMVNPGPVDTDFFETRGHAYAQTTPKPVSPESIAKAIIRVVEKGALERTRPRWLRAATLARTLMPGAYRWGARRAVGKELDELAKR
jgi:short-subunit dehydrogenase